MKKLFFALITATALFSFASCGGDDVESKAKEYVEKIKNAKSETEAEKIYTEMTKWYDGLSADDKKVVDGYMDKL